MSIWGVWTCPKCGRKWEGSMGKNSICSPSHDEWNKRLIKVCGCSDEKLTTEDNEWLNPVMIKLVDKEN